MKLTSIAIFFTLTIATACALAGDTIKTVVPKPKIVDFEGKKTPLGILLDRRHRQPHARQIQSLRHHRSRRRRRHQTIT